MVAVIDCVIVVIFLDAVSRTTPNNVGATGVASRKGNVVVVANDDDDDDCRGGVLLRSSQNLQDDLVGGRSSFVSSSRDDVVAVHGMCPSRIRTYSPWSK